MMRLALLLKTHFVCRPSSLLESESRKREREREREREQSSRKKERKKERSPPPPPPLCFSVLFCVSICEVLKMRGVFPFLFFCLFVKRKREILREK